MADTLLSIQGVSKRFGGLDALSDVSINVRARSIKGLIGPNGAGKTTLFNTITGLVTPDSGTFKLGGVRYHPDSPHVVARVGIARTFQNIRLFANMTVAENVMIGMHIHGTCGVAGTVLRTKSWRLEEADSRGESLRLLEFVDLHGRAERLASALSYGEQRRLEIARALALRPQVLALDEPAAGMNQTEKGRLRDLLRRIVDQRQIAILLIEHDLKLVLGLCDEITVLDYGKVIAEGTPEHIRNSPEFIEAYLGHASQGVTQ